jgi:hypothetical protein
MADTKSALQCAGNMSFSQVADDMLAGTGQERSASQSIWHIPRQRKQYLPTQLRPDTDQPRQDTRHRPLVTVEIRQLTASSSRTAGHGLRRTSRARKGLRLFTWCCVALAVIVALIVAFGPKGSGSAASDPQRLHFGVIVGRADVLDLPRLAP